MNLIKPVVTITAAQWAEKSLRGLAAVIDERQYIVMMHEASRDPVYQAVKIVGYRFRATGGPATGTGDTPRRSAGPGTAPREESRRRS